MPDDRPNPDELLNRVQAEEAEARRGKLKIFFGYAAGVGKTYAMLEAARREKSEGVDVVVGYVEPHGRPETEALLQGLEILPPRQIPYRGVNLAEFDLDAALARRPALILVDELAHTNAPGSRHAKRWQDIQELLEAGIDVRSESSISTPPWPGAPPSSSWTSWLTPTPPDPVTPSAGRTSRNCWRPASTSTRR